MSTNNLWPPLLYEEWSDTQDTLHMKMQVIGKIKLALSPFLNHWWNVAFYLNASGITTGLIPYKGTAFEINFDFISHNLFIRSGMDQLKVIPLITTSVAGFYRDILKALESMGISVAINTLPAEVQNPIPCDVDERSSYNEDYVSRWWKILLQSNMVFERFRARFRGKSSPVQFFWGSFDLSHTRFSGRPAEPPKQGGRIMQFAENEENFACGFWPGNMNYPKPAYYSYIYPAPDNPEQFKIAPKIASYNSKLGEFILNYEDVRKAGSPEKSIPEFLNSTYNECARRAGWDMELLKTRVPE